MSFIKTGGTQFEWDLEETGVALDEHLSNLESLERNNHPTEEGRPSNILCPSIKQKEENKGEG